MLNVSPLIPADPLSDDFADLDSLLADSLKEKKEGIKIKTARAKAANPKLPMPSEERKAIQAKVQEWDTRREWDAQAAVAMFTSQFCEYCGTEHSLFEGILQRQKSRTCSASRWVKVDSNLNDNLPKETKHITTYVPMCVNCAHEHGHPKGEL